MKKIIRWLEAVIAGNHTYASMAEVDLKKSSDRLFEKESEIPKDKEHKKMDKE